MQFTKEAQELAKATVEAIKKIAERQDRECPDCSEKIMHSTVGTEVVIGVELPTQCPKCNGTGKVKGKWEWEPKVGEWVIDKGEVCLIFRKSSAWGGIYLRCKEGETYYPPVEYGILFGKVTPLLHWERVERVLEGMGYYVRVLRNVDKDPNGNHLCECAIDRNEGHIAKVVDKTRQLAVMQAVIELGKGE